MRNKLKKVLVSGVAVTMLASCTLGVSAAELKDLFDAKYYAEKYPDVVAAYGEDEAALYQHYSTFGIREGRKASELFDVANYREQYADLEEAFGDDWAAYINHYLTFGLKEERDGGGEFDAVSYAKRYADVYEAYGYDVKKLYEHYQVFGEKEGRNPESAKVEEQRAAVEAAGSEEGTNPNVAKAVSLISAMEKQYAAFKEAVKAWADTDYMGEEECDIMDECREIYNVTAKEFNVLSDTLMGDCGWPEELQDAFENAVSRLEDKFGKDNVYDFGGVLSAG